VIGCSRCGGSGWLFDPVNRSSVPCAECAMVEAGNRLAEPEDNGPLFRQPEPESRIDREFREFAFKHPEVEKELVKLARKAVAKGRKNFGMKALWEVMRWTFWMEWKEGEEPFKLNNNYTSRYARMLMDKHPELRGFFKTRRLTA